MGITIHYRGANDDLRQIETMDHLRRQNDMRSERMTRRIAEATASGMSADEAFELAMQEEGLSLIVGCQQSVRPISGVEIV